METAELLKKLETRNAILFVMLMQTAKGGARWNEIRRRRTHLQNQIRMIRAKLDADVSKFSL